MKANRVGSIDLKKVSIILSLLIMVMLVSTVSIHFFGGSSKNGADSHLNTDDTFGIPDRIAVSYEEGADEKVFFKSDGTKRAENVKIGIYECLSPGNREVQASHLPSADSLCVNLERGESREISVHISNAHEGVQANNYLCKMIAYDGGDDCSREPRRLGNDEIYEEKVFYLTVSP